MNMLTQQEDAREFLGWLEIERRSRSKKERDFREGKRITREEGRRRERQRTKEEWQLEIELYCSLVLAQEEQEA